MRTLFLLFLCYCLAVSSFAQTKIVFEQTADGIFNYPADQLDRFMNLGKYTSIIIGETHTTNVEPQFKLSLIRQLNDQYHINDVFMEIGHSAAWLFNQYLTTGDSSLFTMPVLAYTNSGGSYYTFWQNLYRYNQSLPATQRIKIHGVDFERTEIFKVLLLLIPKGKIMPENLLPLFQQINSYASDTTLTCFSKDFVHKMETVQQGMKEHMADVASFYGDNLPFVRHMINNDGPHTIATAKRNQCMALNMQQALAEEKIEHFVGFFGSAHTGYSTSGTLPNRIKGWEGYGDKTLVINTVYFNVYSNFKKDTFDVIGWINPKSSQAIYDQYLGKKSRAVLLKSSDINQRQLSTASDFTLLVNDAIRE